MAVPFDHANDFAAVDFKETRFSPCMVEQKDHGTRGLDPPYSSGPPPS